MQESSVSAPPKLSWSRWVRIAYACFMFAVAGLCLWTEFKRFEWALFLCMGLFALVYVPMRKGEAPRGFVSKPRTIISFALLIVVGVAALHNLYDKLIK